MAQGETRALKFLHGEGGFLSDLRLSLFILRSSHEVDRLVTMDGHHDDDGHGHGVKGDGEGVALYKLEAIAITLIIALAGGLLPTRRQVSAKVLSLGNCFSGGIFISAAFLHMLQESVEGFQSLPLKTHFPMAMFCTLLGVLLPFFVERVVLGGHHDHAALLNSEKSKNESSLGIYVLWLMLGVHSIIEGSKSILLPYSHPFQLLLREL